MKKEIRIEEFGLAQFKSGIKWYLGYCGVVLTIFAVFYNIVAHWEEIQAFFTKALAPFSRKKYAAGQDVTDEGPVAVPGTYKTTV